MTTELTVVQRAAIALQSETAAAHLIELAESTKDMSAPTNRAGRDQCHAAAMAALKARTAVVNAAKSARADATAFSRAVIAEEARLVALIEPEEIRLKALRDAYDAEQERIKREAAQREKARANETSEVLARGFRVFDKDRHGISKIQISDADIDAAVELVRSVLRNYVGEEPKTGKVGAGMTATRGALA